MSVLGLMTTCCMLYFETFEVTTNSEIDIELMTILLIKYQKR